MSIHRKAAERFCELTGARILSLDELEHFAVVSAKDGTFHELVYMEHEGFEFQFGPDTAITSNEQPTEDQVKWLMKGIVRLSLEEEFEVYKSNEP